MRIKINLGPKNSDFVIPCHYNGLIQALIYRHLDLWLAHQIHNHGFKDPFGERQMKLFTFSRLIPEKRPEVKDKKITFRGPINLIVSSPYHEFIQSLGSNLLRNGKFYLAGEVLEIISVKIEPAPPYREKVIVKALSPITVYSTLETPDGRKKTYYYNPFEGDFEELIIKNLQRKARTWTGVKSNNSEIETGSYSIRPYKVSKRNERIVIYKDTVIKGWDGLYELILPPELFQMAFDAGLGAKNSHGFGCVEVWK